MKPGAQRLVWLAGVAGFGALAFVLSDWRGESEATLQHAAVAAPAQPVAATAPAPLDETRSAAPATVSASTPTVALPASAALRRPPADASRMQREIQLAVSSNQPGKAGEAARHIQSCQALERDPERRRQAIEANRQRYPEPVYRAMKANHDELLASCQAVDAASRAQLVPLLRRSLDEGDKGAAAGLVQALGREFKPADEPGVVAALRRDAWNCDRRSLSALSNLANRHPQLLTPDEIGALREQQRSVLGPALEAWRRQAENDPQRKAQVDGMMATLLPRPEASPAEVARIAAEIDMRCRAADAALPGMPRAASPG